MSIRRCAHRQRQYIRLRAGYADLKTEEEENDVNARHMATAGLVAAAMILGQGAATAKTWYEKSCTSYGKDKAGNWYVGGPYNKSHLHIGSNFISVFSTNNNSKPETAGKANCTLLKAALGDVERRRLFECGRRDCVSAGRLHGQRMHLSLISAKPGLALLGYPYRRVRPQ